MPNPEQAVQQLVPSEERDRSAYSVLLFPDDYANLGPQLNALVHANLKKAGIRTYEDFSHHSPGTTKTREVDLEEIYHTLGGQQSFFRAGATVLDYGAGIGRATAEYSKIYPKTTIIAIDELLQILPPYSTEYGTYIRGKGYALPFADDTFTGILACEGFSMSVFPRSVIEQALKEITRVAQPGAVFRVTVPVVQEGSDEYYHTAADGARYVDQGVVIEQILSELGWEYFASEDGLVIAHLVKKYKTSIAEYVLRSMLRRNKLSATSAAR